MAPTFGRLEHQITVPAAGWTATVGGNTATITPGTYYMSTTGSQSRSFLDEVAFQFGTASTFTCTATGSLGEGGTGIITITFSSAAAITWVSTDLRDLLGFAGNSASATSHVGTLSARGVWLPTCEYWTKNGGGDWKGRVRADYRTVANAAGHVWAHMGQKRYELDLRWSHVKRSRVWIANETTENQSIERFWLDGIWGEAGWGTPGGPVRWYPDAAVVPTHGTYRVTDAQLFDPDQSVENFTGYFMVKLPMMIQVPGTESVGVWTLPDNAAEWVATFPSITTPTAIFPCQDSSLPLVDTVGALSLASGNASGDEYAARTDGSDPYDRLAAYLEDVASHLRLASSATFDLGASDDLSFYFRFKSATGSPTSSSRLVCKKDTGAATNGYKVTFGGGGDLVLTFDSAAAGQTTATIAANHATDWFDCLVTIRRSSSASMSIYTTLGSATASLTGHAGGTASNAFSFGIGDVSGNLSGCAIGWYSYLAVWSGTILTQANFNTIRGA